MIDFLMPKISVFAEWRKSIHQILAGFNHSTPATDSDLSYALDWFNSLQSIPVSKLSKFGDPVWDFNADEPNAARNVKGAKLRIDFSKYQKVNALALLEIKVALLCYLKAPGSLAVYSAAGKTVKPNTAVSHFQAGLSFINTLSQQARELLTDKFFDSGYHGLCYFDSGMYRSAAAVHINCCGPSLLQFFNILRSPFIKDQVFGESLPFVDLESLPWALKSEPGSNLSKRQRVLPNEIFEKASRAASFAVVDFLSALGEEVADKETLARRNVAGYFVSVEYSLTKNQLNAYTAVRLSQKGYSVEEIEKVLGFASSDLYSVKFENQFKVRPTLEKLYEAQLGERFRRYVNFVFYSAAYLVAQYTGMRPSELSEILVRSCLEQDDGRWVLVSNVIKHKQNLTKLFDDKWVAIPIVRDAVRVAQIVSRIKSNPYLFSNVDTVAPGAVPMSMASLGISHQLSSFFMEVLTDEEYENLDFSAYTLRHTLAYQMARADLGLPFISYQLKHFGDLVGSIGQNKAFSEVTLGYGEIAEILAKGGRSSGKLIREMADREYIENFCDPDANYAGPTAAEHKLRLKKVFEGYMASGYTKEEVFAQMVKQRIAVINVGQGFCYGGRKEEFDESLPCIGSLRCNPNQCKNAVVTKANAPKWREVYLHNQKALPSALSASHELEIRAAMEEAKGVLEHLGEEVDE